MVLQAISKPFTKVFGSRNDRLIRACRRRVEQINALEASIRPLTDAELREKTSEFRRRYTDGEPMAELLPQVMAVAREATGSSSDASDAGVGPGRR